MARRAWSKLETGGGGGRRNWPAKNDPYKYAAAIETGPRLPKRFDSLHLRFRSRDSKFKRREDVSTIIPSFRADYQIHQLFIPFQRKTRE